MDQGFVDILKELIEEQGKEAILNASKCKAFLADYTKNEYKNETRLLLKGLEIGVQNNAFDHKDYDEVFKWYSKAAEHGGARAQFNLGS